MAEIFLDQRTTIETANPTFRAIVQDNGLDNLPGYLEDCGLAANRAFVITDSNVKELYGEQVSATLEDGGIEHEILTMPAGEEHKTQEQASDFVKQLADSNATRSDTVIALGGGVVGDLGGFVASVYNRGIPLVQVPTTLLAMVDASIGGKTGVDHGGKNKMGSFHQPKLVLADPSVLGTLDERVYTEGFGEIVKYAMLDADLMPELKEQAKDLRAFSPENLRNLSRLIARCIKQKSDVIAADPHENAPGGRILLNYGHTLGHGLEAAGNYTELLHGEAVAIGMNYAAQLAVTLGFAEESLVSEQIELLETLGLPTQYSGAADIEDIMSHIAKDKKSTASATTRFVLPHSPGVMSTEQINNGIVHKTVTEFLRV